MIKISIGIITIYQRYLSPYKGFSCASGVYYGEGTCSGVVKNIIQEKGLFAGWKDVKEQFMKCRKAAILLANQKADEPTQSDENDQENEKKQSSDKSNWCFLAPASCAIPDPSDCTFASAAEGASGACGGAAEGVTGACSCL